MNNNNLNIKAKSVIFCNFFKDISEKHVVPTLQRPYVWKEKKQVKKFLDDIAENSSSYFIGSLVFVSPRVGTVGREDIIDGQQRMITIALILISIRDIIEEFKMEKKLERILIDISYFLMEYDSFRDEKIVRLTFSNENTDLFFKKMLERRGQNPVGTQKSLSSNYFFIKEYLLKLFKKGESKKLEIDKVEKYFHKIKSLQMIGITCMDNSVAYKLFESINATSLSLASVDLIKNFIFLSSKNDKQLTQVEIGWQSLEDIFSEDRDSLKKFIRHQWLSEGKYTSHSALYDAVIKEYEKGDLDPGVYASKLLEDAKIYYSLRNISIDSLDKINEGKRFKRNEIKETLEFIDFLNVDQIYAPILYFYKNTNKNDFKTYLNKLAAFSFLYKYIPGSPSAAEKIFVDFSKSGKKGFDKNFQKLNKLVYKSKDIFVETFCEGALYRNTKNGHIQFVLERYIFSKGGPASFKEPTIEHIISQTIDKSKICQTIGNLTVFEEPINSELPPEFKDKIPFYEKSVYPEHLEILSKYTFHKEYKKSILRRSEDLAGDVYDIFIEILNTGKLK